MRDPRGVERGACTKCECKAYDLEVNATKAACSYCECPAPAHKAVDEGAADGIESQSSDLTASNNSSFSAASSSTPIPVAQASGSSNSDIVTLEVTNANQPFFLSLFNQSNSNGPSTDEIFLPATENLPGKCKSALKRRNLKHNDKAAVCRFVFSNLAGRGQTDNKCLEKAAKKMARTWSPLKEAEDPNNMILFNLLRNRRDRLSGTGNSTVASSAASTSHDNMSALDAKKKMFYLWSSDNRGAEVHKNLMVIARPLLNVEVEARKLPGLNLFRAYPALTLNEVLLQEFLAVMEITEEAAKARWAGVLPLLKEHYKVKKIPFNEGSVEEETLSVLEGFYRANTMWYKQDNEQDRLAKILELFPESTPPDELQPTGKHPPRLIGIGSFSDGSLSITAYFDSEPCFVEENPFRALLLLLSLFFVCKVKWPAKTRLPYIFLTSAVAGIGQVRTNLYANQKLVDLLKEFNIYSTMA